MTDSASVRMGVPPKPIDQQVYRVEGQVEAEGIVQRRWEVSCILRIAQKDNC